MGVDDKVFLDAISTFSGASKRLQLLRQNDTTAVFKDFAHSPSKLKASVTAVKELYPERKLIACIELHTYSSLNKDFLPLYKGCMERADVPVLYYSHHALSMKRLAPLKPEEVRNAFGDGRIIIYNDSVKMREDLLSMDYEETCLLLMSSGNFDGIDLEGLADDVLS
jgi:UDP-N-acetylmuramate: L-alanyl-gamma-D-glutamyl-meso-diaminopimelate ligase